MAKILIIDDEKSIRNTLREILEYEKYDVDLAEDGIKGIEKVKNNDDEPYIDIHGLREELNSFTYPLHFISVIQISLFIIKFYLLCLSLLKYE